MNYIKERVSHIPGHLYEMKSISNDLFRTSVLLVNDHAQDYYLKIEQHDKVSGKTHKLLLHKREISQIENDILKLKKFETKFTDLSTETKTKQINRDDVKIRQFNSFIDTYDKVILSNDELQKIVNFTKQVEEIL